MSKANLRINETHVGEIIEMCGDRVCSCTFIRCEFTGKADAFVNSRFVDSYVSIPFKTMVSCTVEMGNMSAVKQHDGGD